MLIFFKQLILPLRDSVSIFLLSIISISSVVGQVNIEGLRNPELNKTNFSVEIDSDIATQSNKDNWEITSELRFDKLFDNQ